jgi:hypothetical protein
MSEISDGNCVAYQTVGWRAEISAIAGPLEAFDTRDSWLHRAARRALVSHRHIKALFYGEMADPKYSVAYKVLIAAQKARVDAAKIDAQALSKKFETIARGMQNAGQDHGGDVATLLHAARLLAGAVPDLPRPDAPTLFNTPVYRGAVDRA